jgi:hypothetical protein
VHRAGAAAPAVVTDRPMALNLTPRRLLIERVAQAIYATHWRRPAPAWDETSEDVRDFVRAQALSAINEIRTADRETLSRRK